MQLASIVKYRGSLSGGVNICVSVGGMPDGKEVAGGAGTSCGRILRTVVQTVAAGGWRGGSAARSESRPDVTRT